MKVQFNFRNAVIEIICLLYVLLFVYAATSKLLDFQHFKIELGQSPLLSAFAEWVAVLVPAAEYITCLLLIIPRFRLIGIFLAYGLMVMFTAYIFIILNYTSFVPCSCGGVLEKLDWKSHMFFNLIFVFLGVLGILVYKRSGKTSNRIVINRNLIALFSIISLSGISLVTVLFMLSENIVHYHNKLTRRFPHSPVRLDAKLDLKINSYYIAGGDSSNIYLGNVTAPLTVTTLSKDLLRMRKNMVELNRKDMPFRAIRINVLAPYFFVADGTVPCIFTGKTDNWKAELVHQKGEYFTTVVPIDSTTVAVSTNSKKNGDNVLGVINAGIQKHTILNTQILQKQFDGVFDTDGHLLYSKDMQSIIYLYAYRNQFTITDKKLKIKKRGTTLDTISHAKLSVAVDRKYQLRQFSKPPLYVNKASAVYKNLLFVNSAVPGRYEDDRMWDRANIIDVYDLSVGSYLLSFTIDNLGEKKLKSFIVRNDRLYALIGNHILNYKIDNQITSNYNN